MGIKKRNLDDSLVSWVQQQMQLPLGVGNIKYVAATSAWRQFLMDQGVADTIYSNPKTAYDACTASQNDVVVVFPGSYDFGDVWTWSKAYTHMIGVGPVGMTQHPVELYHSLDSTETTGQFKVTGSGCMFKNLMWHHTASAAAAVYNVYITGDDCTFDYCQFANGNDSVVSAADMKGVGLIGATDIVFRNCVIGGTETERTASAADMTLDTGCDNLFFYDCVFVANLDATADASHAFIETADAAAVTELLYMENCAFINTGGHAANPTAIITQADLAAAVVLRNCELAGVADFSDDEEKIWVSSGGHDDTPGKVAGVMIQPDVT